MSTSWDIFGPIVSLPMVEQAVIDLAQTWLPTYIEAVGAAMGAPAGSIQKPKSWQTSYDFDNRATLPTPAFVVVCDRLMSVEHEGDGGFGGWVRVEAGVLANDTTEASARKVAGLYQMALAMMLEQRPSLNGISSATEVTGLSITLPDTDTRTQALGQVTAQTFIVPMFDSLAGPQIPSDTVPPIPGPPDGGPYPDPTTQYPDELQVEHVFAPTVEGEELDA